MIRQRWMYTTLTTLTLAAFASVAAAFEDDAMPGAKAESSALTGFSLLQRTLLIRTQSHNSFRGAVILSWNVKATMSVICELKTETFRNLGLKLRQSFITSPRITR